MTCATHYAGPSSPSLSPLSAQASFKLTWSLVLSSNSISTPPKASYPSATNLPNQLRGRPLTSAICQRLPNPNLALSLFLSRRAPKHSSFSSNTRRMFISRLHLVLSGRESRIRQVLTIVRPLRFHQTSASYLPGDVESTKLAAEKVRFGVRWFVLLVLDED